MRTYLPLLDPITIADYPYGFALRTSITYQIEYKKGKGYRLSTTTVNPKTGKLNKPKLSTYHSFARLYREDDIGYIKLDAFEPYSIEDYEKAMASGIFEGIHKDTYDHEKRMAYTVFQSVRWECTYCGITNSNPVIPKKLTPEQVELLKLWSYEANKKVLSEIRSTQSE